MATEFAGLHAQLRSVAEDLLAKEKASGAGISWPTLARVGWVGLEAPDDSGGAGATFAEVAVVLDEMGRAASSSAYFGSAVLGVGALTSLAEVPPLLSDVVAGDAEIAVALSGADFHGRTPFAITDSADGLHVTGRAEYVPDIVAAQQLLLPARDRDGVPVLVHIAAGGAGVTVTEQPVLDETRRFGAVVADNATIDASSVWRFASEADAAVARLSERASLAIACDSLGLSEAMLAATVDYVGVRHQFGRAIGSFQAVKHACADMLVRVSVARQLVVAAVNATATDDPDASTAVSMAKAYACDAAVAVAGSAMQLHGGIGYTWESGVHVYLKRATLNRSLFGSPAEHRKRLAKRYV